MEEFLFIYSKFEVHKFGGTITGTKKGLSRITEIACGSARCSILVVSAATGITDLLIKTLEREINESVIEDLIEQIMQRHTHLAEKDMMEVELFAQQLERLKRVLYGVYYTEELTESLHDLILSFGERLIALVVRERVNTVLKENRFRILYPEEFLVTNGHIGQVTINLERSYELLSEILQRDEYDGLIIPGFYGKTPEGKIKLFGRSGTDYSASAIGYLVGTEKIIIWKDVGGFMSVDPKLVSDAMRIPELSYNEAAELSHFGAKILHHRAVLPAKLAGIPIEVRNIYDPSQVSVIKAEAIDTGLAVRSISFMNGLTILKFYNTFGAADIQILSGITAVLSKLRIDVMSIATSQTCVSFLVKGYKGEREFLESALGGYIDNVEVYEEMSLISCVGDKLSTTKGIASRVFTILHKDNVNVDMISAGASGAALHFTVATQDLERAVKAVHREFMIENR